MSNHLLNGFMEGLLDLEAGHRTPGAFLRNHYMFVIVPMLNPDGTSVGNVQATLSGQSVPKVFGSPDRHLHPEAFFLRKLLHTLSQNNEIELVLELGSSNTKYGSFVRGCEPDYQQTESNTVPAEVSRQRELPLLFSDWLSNFDFDKCIFCSKKSVESVSSWIRKVLPTALRSFKFLASSFGSSPRTTFQLDDYRSMGKQLCQVIGVYFAWKVPQLVESRELRDLSLKYWKTTFPDDEQHSVSATSKPSNKVTLRREAWDPAYHRRYSTVAPMSFNLRGKDPTLLQRMLKGFSIQLKEFMSVKKEALTSLQLENSEKAQEIVTAEPKKQMTAIPTQTVTQAFEPVKEKPFVPVVKPVLKQTAPVIVAQQKTKSDPKKVTGTTFTAIEISKEKEEQKAADAIRENETRRTNIMAAGQYAVLNKHLVSDAVPEHMLEEYRLIVEERNLRSEDEGDKEQDEPADEDDTDQVSRSQHSQGGSKVSYSKSPSLKMKPVYKKNVLVPNERKFTDRANSLESNSDKKAIKSKNTNSNAEIKKRVDQPKQQTSEIDHAQSEPASASKLFVKPAHSRLVKQGSRVHPVKPSATVEVQNLDSSGESSEMKAPNAPLKTKKGAVVQSTLHSKAHDVFTAKDARGFVAEGWSTNKSALARGSSQEAADDFLIGSKENSAAAESEKILSVPPKNYLLKSNPQSASYLIPHMKHKKLRIVTEELTSRSENNPKPVRQEANGKDLPTANTGPKPASRKILKNSTSNLKLEDKVVLESKTFKFEDLRPISSSVANPTQNPHPRSTKPSFGTSSHNSNLISQQPEGQIGQVAVPQSSHKSPPQRIHLQSSKPANPKQPPPTSDQNEPASMPIPGDMENSSSQDKIQLLPEPHKSPEIVWFPQPAPSNRSQPSTAAKLSHRTLSRTFQRPIYSKSFKHSQNATTSMSNAFSGADAFFPKKKSRVSQSHRSTSGTLAVDQDGVTRTSSQSMMLSLQPGLSCPRCAGYHRTLQNIAQIMFWSQLSQRTPSRVTLTSIPRGPHSSCACVCHHHHGPPSQGVEALLVLKQVGSANSQPVIDLVSQELDWSVRASQLEDGGSDMRDGRYTGKTVNREYVRYLDPHPAGSKSSRQVIFKESVQSQGFLVEMPNTANSEMNRNSLLLALQPHTSGLSSSYSQLQKSRLFSASLKKDYSSAAQLKHQADSRLDSIRQKASEVVKGPDIKKALESRTLLAQAILQTSLLRKS